MLSESLTIPFTAKPLSGKIKVPGSKSITNRALVMAALATGTSRVRGYLNAEDTSIMIACLVSLGVKVKRQENCLLIEGVAGVFREHKDTLFVANAGTVARFLCPLLTLGKGSYNVDGSSRMRQRPIAELTRAMQLAGGKVQPLGEQSFPLVVEGARFLGGAIKLKGNVSSQFISALMMVAPFAKQDTSITITTEVISLPYIEMTRKMMESFGVRCDWVSASELFIAAHQQYQARDYQVEGDASAASYFFAAAAISKGRVGVYPMIPNSLQGDLGFLQILKNMGCRIEWGVGEVFLQATELTNGELEAVEVDMSQQNDVALTLAVVALFAKGVTKINNIYNLRLKECDRVKALASELAKLGAKVVETKDSLTIEGLQNYHSASIETYQDHRVAMAFSLCGLKISGVQIKNPTCVQKTYPNYWKNFLSLLKGAN